MVPVSENQTPKIVRPIRELIVRPGYSLGRMATCNVKGADADTLTIAFRGDLIGTFPRSLFETLA